MGFSRTAYLGLQMSEKSKGTGAISGVHIWCLSEIAHISHINSSDNIEVLAAGGGYYEEMV